MGWSRLPAWINKSNSSPSWLRQKYRSGLRPRLVKALMASTTTHPSSSAPPMGPAGAASALGWRVSVVTSSDSKKKSFGDLISRLP